MAKPKTVFVCQTCHYQSPKWLGRCPDCQAWGTLVEETVEIDAGSTESRPRWTSEEAPRPISDIGQEDEDRLVIGLSEMDRVLGGGIVPGSVVLLGGDPGIGKSTIMLQCLKDLASRGAVCLYVSAEESVRQAALRARRLGSLDPKLMVVAEASLERIISHAEQLKPRVLVVDSIQAIYTSELGAAPGSISQVRETAGRLTAMAKGTGFSTTLVGHVTKDGAIAGPKVLEHMVDTVLYMERSADSPYRILRAVKNRFGSTNEIGVFEMDEKGLREVPNPSEIFLAERPVQTSGSVVLASIEGTRPILVEIQALATSTAFAVPRRIAMGIDYNRLSLLVSVLEKKMGMNLSHHDVFVNVAGGLRVDEPAVDLGVVAAVASSFTDKAIPQDVVVFGELGLTGEVRGVSFGAQRVREATRLGFRTCILPRTTAERDAIKDDIRLVKVRNLRDVWNALFGKQSA